MNGIVDRTLLDGGLWERGTFTVPAEIPDERVQDVAYRYQRKYGVILERQGFTVKRMLRPVVSTRLGTPPGRRRYDIWAWVTRDPITIRYDIPDLAVPAMQKAGMKLID